MKTAFALLLLTTVAGTPLAAEAAAGGYPAGGNLPYPAQTRDAGGRAPWSAAWQYDSGSDNDRRPELPYYQQGGGQQTGGPARNLLPDDGLHLAPR